MEHKDELYSLLKSSKLEMPFADFEEQAMNNILNYERSKEEMTKSKKMAILFFLIGTVFGMMLNYVGSLFVASYGLSENLQDKLSFFSQLVYVILILLFSDKLWKFFKISKNRPIKN